MVPLLIIGLFIWGVVMIIWGLCDRFWSPTVNDRVGKYYDDILSRLKSLEDIPEELGDLQPSLEYLSRPDVKARYIEIISEIPQANMITCELQSILGLIFLEMKVDELDGPHVTVLNFWPCEECACVGVEVINKNDPPKAINKERIPTWDIVTL